MTCQESVQFTYDTSDSSQELGKKPNSQVDRASGVTSEQLSQPKSVVKKSK